jgi:POT family proton-dependent oligopeptide transporter
MLHNLTSQAATMNTHGIPNDFISNVNPFTLIILIPIFDQLVYPLLRRYNINFSPLKRITAGFFAVLLAMVWSAVTQVYIYRMSPCKEYANECGGKTAPMSAWIQTGPLGELPLLILLKSLPLTVDSPAKKKKALLGLSELLAVTTGMEYCYTKAPTNMRSLVYAIYLSMTAIASAVGQAFLPLSDDPLLVWNYSVMSLLLLLATVGFWCTFRALDKEESEESACGAGRCRGEPPSTAAVDEEVAR